MLLLKYNIKVPSITFEQQQCLLHRIICQLMHKNVSRLSARQNLTYLIFTFFLHVCTIY